MLIVPYVHKITTQNDLHIHSIMILTMGGKDLWEEDQSLNIHDDVLKPNDMYSTETLIKMDNNIILIEIDTDKTNIGNMYKWDEIDIHDNETFCWRNYIYVGGSKNESWLNIPNNEKLGNINVRNIIKTIINYKK